jgi:hypothetical protein
VRFPRATRFPLYRQSVMYAREGVELDRSLLATSVGHGAKLLQPLVEALRRHVMAARSWIRRCLYSHLATAKQRPDACGSMYVTIAHRRT